MQDYLYALVQHFVVMGVSSMLTLETDPPVLANAENQGRLSHMTDNIIFLELHEHNGSVGRRLRIVKARGAAHDLQYRELQISDEGLRVVKAVR
jgi:circadian clock protein KaiC